MYEVWQAPDVVVALGTLLAGAGACVGAFVAFNGLSTWKRQQTWKIEHDLAVQIYGSFRKRREIYNYIRSPHSNPPYVNNEARRGEIYVANQNNDRLKRQILYWQELKEVEVSSAKAFDEAQLRWSIDLREMSQELVELEHELISALDDLKEAQLGSFRPSREEQKKIDETVTSARDGTDRKGRYGRVVKNLEQILKPKIV